MQLWQLKDVPGLHELVWLSSFFSFYFLYPSTFNLLEVAAIDKPKVHLWEKGIMRITRHPQMVWQVIWCLAHTLWIGNTIAVATSIRLIGHHLFGVWNGDRRMASRYGEAFEVMKSRTSVFPFAAIINVHQKLPKDYYKELALSDHHRANSRCLFCSSTYASSQFSPSLVTYMKDDTFTWIPPFCIKKVAIKQ